MSWYSQKFLPRMLDRGMQDDETQEQRALYMPRARGVVLDVGAGSATNLPFFTGDVTKMYELEPSKELYALGAERVAKAPFPVEHLSASAEEIPLPDNSIDTVVTAFCLCSIPNPVKALKELRRVLKSDGVYLFVDHGLAPGFIARTTQQVFTPVSKHFTGNCHLDRKIDDLIKEAGFTITSFEPTGTKRPLIYLYRGEARK